MSFGKFKEPVEGDKEKKEASSFVDKFRAAAKPQEPAAAATSKAYLGKGSKIVGTLTFEGPAELDGQVEGEIHAADLLIIGEAAVIKAKVLGNDVTIRGQVLGDVSARTRIALEKPARVVGNLTCPTLRIDEGVVFEGSCSMAKS